MREAVRECQMTITHAMLKGHCGAMAPVKELEPQLLKKSTRMDLEGDPNRRYFVFAAKNRSREDSDKVKQEPHHGTSTVAMPTPPPLPAFAFNVAQAGALQAGAGGHANPQSVVSERLEALLGGAQTSRPRERASEQLGALLGGALGAGSSVSRPPAVQQAAAVKQEVPGMGSVRVPASPVRPVSRLHTHQNCLVSPPVAVAFSPFRTLFSPASLSPQVGPLGRELTHSHPKFLTSETASSIILPAGQPPKALNAKR